MLLLRAFLGAAQPPRRRRRAEVRAAIAAPRRGGRAEAAAARARTSESAWPARARAAEAPSLRPWPEPTLAGWTRRTILARARLADGEVAPLKWLRIESLDDFVGLAAVRKLDEREAAWTAGLTIDRHDNVGGLCDGSEVGAEVRLTGSVRQVPDEQTDCQGLLEMCPRFGRPQILSQNGQWPGSNAPVNVEYGRNTRCS